jgi:gamma-glutamyltranspeptidase / glutathione hydrolase
MNKLATFTLIAALTAGVGAAQDRGGVTSRDGLVVCTSAPACDAGASILAAGGNAVDAAVATAFALAVTYPAAGNIGGGGFMIVRTPAGEVAAVDYRERAPLAATPQMYLGPDGTIQRQLTSAGHLAAGVPGSVRGLEAAHARFGTLPWREVVMPGVRLAEEGFEMSAALAESLNAALVRMTPFPASVAAYGRPGGGDWQEGDRLVLPDLGRTLRAIAVDGADAFYTGWIADRIAEDMAANGGLITREDLAAYEAKIRTPIRGSYRGFDVISMPPPSSGGVALVQMLNILEPFDLRSKGLLTAPALHLQIEAMRRAYLDRARHLGDPDFSDIPVARLTSREHARHVAASIHDARPSDSLDLGRDLLESPQREEPAATTHYSIVDRNGMAVATTTTLEGSYGSFVVVEGAGFLLNNEMGDFNMKPGYTNTTGDIGSPANVIAPGKRMLSSMTPTIVAKDERVVLVTGTPGGRTIINTVLTIVLGVVEYGLDGEQAVALPRMHHQWMPDEVRVEQAMAPAAVADLRAIGHAVSTRERQGDAHSIWIAPDGTPHGIPDLRTADSKASTPAQLTARGAER